MEKEGLDLDALEKIARKARVVFPGEWWADHQSPHMSGSVWNLKTRDRAGIRATISEYQHGTELQDYLLTFNPEMVLGLIYNIWRLIDKNLSLQEKLDEEVLAGVIASGYEPDTPKAQIVNRHDIRAARAVIAYLKGENNE